MGFSAQHILLLLIIGLLLFGRGKISELMGDVAKGIKSFKKGMVEDDTPEVTPTPTPTPRTLDRTIENDVASSDRTKVG